MLRCYSWLRIQEAVLGGRGGGGKGQCQEPNPGLLPTKHVLSLLSCLPSSIEQFLKLQV